MGLSGQDSALASLLSATEGLTTNFSVSINESLGQLVTDALTVSTEPWLGELLASFGWEGGCFTRAVDVRELSSRLKALTLEGLQEKGRGAYAVVYKVRTPLCVQVAGDWGLGCNAPRRLTWQLPAQARDRLTGDVVTLKKLKLERQDEGIPSSAIREVSLLRELQHPHIVRHAPPILPGTVQRASASYSALRICKLANASMLIAPHLDRSD